MGFDFANHQWFLGPDAAGKSAGDLAVSVRDLLRLVMRDLGYEAVAAETEADRSLVVGPPGRWVFVGDSASSYEYCEYADDRDFTALSARLSAVRPVVDAHVSDSCWAWFRLYQEGRLLDQFGDTMFPADREAYCGHFELWADVLPGPADVAALRSVWGRRSGQRAEETLAAMAQVFGWHPHLVQMGYTIFDEQQDIRYSDLILPDRIDPTALTELHFRKTSQPVTPPPAT